MTPLTCDLSPGGKYLARDVYYAGGAQVILLSDAVGVCSLALARAAKIEPQNRKARCLKRLGNSVGHFVMHSPAEERMRVADDCSSSDGSAGLLE